jgi:hypothetical protein
MNIILLTCVRKELEAIVDELRDWEQEKGFHILLSGTTNKAGDGFIIIRCRGPIPMLFHQKAAEDGDFLDYIVFDSGVFRNA